MLKEILKVIDHWQKVAIRDDSHDFPFLYVGDAEDVPEELREYEVIEMYVDQDALVIEVEE